MGVTLLNPFGLLNWAKRKVALLPQRVEVYNLHVPLMKPIDTPIN